MDSQGIKAEITEDTRLKGEATPGTNTPCVEVPPGEIETPDNQVMQPDGIVAKPKAKAKRKSKRSKAKSSKTSVDGEAAYDLKAGGMTWTEVASHMDVNSPWMHAGLFAKANDLPYPPEKRQTEEKGLIETVVDAVEDHEFPEDDPTTDESEEEIQAAPKSLPPVLPTFQLFELKKHPHMEKTALGHTHTLVFEIGHSKRSFGLQGEPSAMEVLKIIARETRKLNAGR